MLILFLTFSILVWIIGIFGIYFKYRKSIKEYPRTERKVALLFLTIWPITFFILLFLLISKKFFNGMKRFT